MARISPHEALIGLMVAASAADRSISETELARIAEVVRGWPVFLDFRHERLPDAIARCRSLLEAEGAEALVSAACRDLPRHIHDTAYAAAFEVAAADSEMCLDELRALQRLREALHVDPPTIAAIERANKARQRTLT